MMQNILEEGKFDIEDEDNSFSEIINLFYRIYKIVKINNEYASDIYHECKNHVYKNLLHVDER